MVGNTQQANARTHQTHMKAVGGGGVTLVMHGRSRVTIDYRTPTRCRDGARRVFTDPTDVVCVGELLPAKEPFVRQTLLHRDGRV